ncbi:MAG TPA: type II toxin-antitoxin system prevent-host-death family antitoxin [Vicinamibacterales bacterium]|nr:type II toxin-antitoxin system prevent-host-death family antitoxin [Vicinamibacterales bacterium]
MATSDVGSRELKTRLGAYLRQVRDGHSFIVTDRGEPVAELRPIGRDTSTTARLARLAARGTVTRQRRGALAPFEPARIRRGASATKLISEDREDRA